MTRWVLMLAAAAVMVLARPALGGELQEAARAGDVEKVMRLLTEKPELVNSQDRGTTALHEAARAGQLETTDCLIKSGADANASDNSGCTPLKLALGYGRKEVAELLKRNGGTLIPTPKGSPKPGPLPGAPALPALQPVLAAPAAPVLTAPGAEGIVGPPAPQPAWNASPRVAAPVARPFTNRASRAAAPLAPGPVAGKPAASPGTNAPKGMDPLFFPIHEAARVGDLAQVVALLKDWPETLDSMDEKGLTPLHLAAQAGRREMVDLLLKRGADPRARSKTGMTPLHWAAARGQTNVLVSLAAAGAELDARDAHGQTPLFHAARGNHTGAARELLAMRANASAADLQGTTPLLVAAALGEEAIVRELLAAGARCDATEPGTGMTPLHLAVGMRNQAMVAMLLAAKANPNTPDARGVAPLEYALRDGQDAVAALLRAKGATQASSQWSVLEQGLVDHYRKTEAVLLRGASADKRKVLTESLPTQPEVERIFLKDASRVWKTVSKMRSEIRSASEADLAARGGGSEALRVQVQAPGALTEHGRRLKTIAGDLPIGSLQLSQAGGARVTQDYCYVNQRWVMLPPLENVFPEWNAALTKERSGK